MYMPRTPENTSSCTTGGQRSPGHNYVWIMLHGSFIMSKMLLSIIYIYVCPLQVAESPHYNTASPVTQLRNLDPLLPHTAYQMLWCLTVATFL